MPGGAVIVAHPPFTIHLFETVTSTNDLLKSMLDAPGYTCVSASEQTAGRGRAARQWHSEKGSGLYLSVLLIPEISPERIPIISLLAGVALAEATCVLAPELADELDIKWPNDLMIAGRKAGGILCEGISGSALRVVAGIGVNLNQERFPEELEGTATSLLMETGRSIELVKFRNLLLDRIAWWYEVLQQGDASRIVSRWAELSTYTEGKRVRIIYPHEVKTGVTCGLSENGALKLRRADGKVEVILAGEIEHLRE